LSLRLFFLFIYASSFLFSFELQEDYEINGFDFNASHINTLIKDDFVIYHFDKNKHKKSFTASKILKKFQDAGIELMDNTKGIVHVKRSSQFNYASVSNEIKAYYQNFYPHISIKEVNYLQKSFIDDLGKDYSLHFKSKAYLYQRSSLQIRSKKTDKRYFITYEITATLKVFKARHNINRGKLLTPLDLNINIEPFKRFKSIPVQNALKGRLRLKKRLIEGKILYLQDIEKLPDVLKNKEVNVRYISGNVHLEFIAISLEDGHIGEEINIKKRDGQRLKAKVISPNLVEIQ